MKPRIIAIVIILLFQNRLLFAQIEPKNPVFWGNLGITQLIYETKYVFGANYQIKPKHVIGFEFYQFGELEEGGIIFGDEIPNRVRESTTLKLIYGYCINPKNQFFKIIPSIGIGSTSGLFRNNNLISNSWGKNYEEIKFSGMSISPQIDLILHNKWLGIGLIISNNNTFEPTGYFLENWKTYSSIDFAFKICIGNLN
ncbi:MAG: hypothetical protein JHD28_07885 [Bacteroidia bacterium]|nr:hypothetical protein [Bacteroidia bacterium]